MASIAIGSIIKSGNRIKIRANLGGQLANILIDSGAACSCTDIPLPLTNETIPIQGIGDTIMIATKTQPVQLDLGVTVLEESLWYLPNNSEGTVLGMGIMRKYGFVIHCFEKQIELKTEKTVKKCLLLDFKSSCVIKNRRKASNIKVLKFIDQNSALGCFSDKSLTKKQPRNTFLQSLYSMHRRVSASHWLGIRPGLLKSAPTSFVLLPRCSVSFSAKITHDRALDSALF